VTPDGLDDPAGGGGAPGDDLVARQVDLLSEPAVDDREDRTDDGHGGDVRVARTDTPALCPQQSRDDRRKVLDGTCAVRRDRAAGALRSREEPGDWAQLYALAVVFGLLSTAIWGLLDTNPLGILSLPDRRADAIFHVGTAAIYVVALMADGLAEALRRPAVRSG
jgi:hypothetical protein